MQVWQPPEHDLLDHLTCEVCGSGTDDHELMLCDGCDRGFHTYCLGLDGVPPGEWFCSACKRQMAHGAHARFQDASFDLRWACVPELL